MEEVTLKVNLIVGGQHYLRGSVVSKALLPLHLRTNKYIAKGAIHINSIMPIDMMEVGDEEIEEEGESSPMRELTMEEVQPKLKRRIAELEDDEEEEPRAKITNKRIARR